MTLATPTSDGVRANFAFRPCGSAPRHFDTSGPRYGKGVFPVSTPNKRKAAGWLVLAIVGVALFAWVVPSVAVANASPLNRSGSVPASESSPPDPPSARDGPSMTYDAKDGYVLLFGGCNTHLLGGTWKLANGKWTKLEPRVSPPARLGASMTYDAADGYVVLFGGYRCNPATTASCFLRDTWKFVDGSWTNISTSAAPAARAGPTMTYDVRDRYALLFGGGNLTTHYSDTWTFVGGVWTKLSPTTHPSTRFDVGLVYDARDGYVLLYGGNSPNFTHFHDTWTFVGGIWTKLEPQAAPSVYLDAGMVYDAKDRYVLLFGEGPEHNWEFAGGVWKTIAPNPAPVSRHYGSMAYDATDGYAVLFGGRTLEGGLANSTWTFEAGAWTEVS